MFIIDFSDRVGAEKTMQKTWFDFRSALSAGKFSYCEHDKAKEKTVFFKAFDDLFHNCHQFFDVVINNDLAQSFSLIRAARLHTDPDELTYSRFIPDKRFITNHNRFSPAGVEWLYLAVGDLRVAETCALKECRASMGEKFGICQFAINEDYFGKKLVDLTIAKDTLFEELNEELQSAADEICNREVLKALKSITYRGKMETPNICDYEKSIKKWATYTYIRMLSEQIFVPLETDDRELVYSPFQCMAQYFLSLGYEGIVYSSTVFPDGKNMVLFEKNAAKPIGDIKIITYSE